MKKPAIEGGKPVRPANSKIVFGRPDIRKYDILEVVDVLGSGWLSTGPVTAKFEKAFAEYQGVKYALGTNSCTSALHLALLALELKPGTEVITTDMSFVATTNAIIHAGLKPVLVDCERGTQNISVEQVKKHITPNTGAILPVHFAGWPCDMEALREICDERGLYLISDCAHSIEARLDGKSMAELSDISSYSFYATKNICISEGGMLLTNNKEWYEKSKIRSLHGMSKGAAGRYSGEKFKHYQVETLGFKYNMPDVLAAMGINQLKRIDDNYKKRSIVWDRYMAELNDLPIFLPPTIPNNIKHGKHLFTAQLDLDKITISRDEFLNAITQENVSSGVHYIPIHIHPYYKKTFGWNTDKYSNANWIGERTFSLPLGSNLTRKDVDDVIVAVRKLLEYYRK